MMSGVLTAHGTYALKIRVQTGSNPFRYSTHALGVQPLQIAPIAGVQGQNDELGRVVRMQVHDQAFQTSELAGRGLEEDQNFRAAFQFGLPPIVRFDPWQKVGAGNEACFQGATGQAAGRFQIWSGDKRDFISWCDHADGDRLSRTHGN
jgi:hypothetical protein